MMREGECAGPRVGAGYPERVNEDSVLSAEKEPTTFGEGIMMEEEEVVVRARGLMTRRWRRWKVQERREAANLLAGNGVTIRLRHENNTGNNGGERCKHKSKQNKERECGHWYGIHE